LRRFAGKQVQANSDRFEQRRLMDSCQMREAFGRGLLMEQQVKRCFCVNKTFEKLQIASSIRSAQGFGSCAPVMVFQRPRLIILSGMSNKIRVF
jgi:hypothetical protein